MVIYMMYIWIHYNDITVTSECWLGFDTVSSPQLAAIFVSRIFQVSDLWNRSAGYTPNYLHIRMFFGGFGDPVIIYHHPWLSSTSYRYLNRYWWKLTTILIDDMTIFTRNHSESSCPKWIVAWGHDCWCRPKKSFLWWT